MWFMKLKMDMDILFNKYFMYTASSFKSIHFNDQMIVCLYNCLLTYPLVCQLVFFIIIKDEIEYV